MDGSIVHRAGKYASNVFGEHIVFFSREIGGKISSVPEDEDAIESYDVYGSSREVVLAK